DTLWFFPNNSIHNTDGTSRSESERGSGQVGVRQPGRVGVGKWPPPDGVFPIMLPKWSLRQFCSPKIGVHHLCSLSTYRIELSCCEFIPYPKLDWATQPQRRWM